MGRIRPATAAELPFTYRPGCPVDLADLAAVSFTHLGFDGLRHEGAVVVHRLIAEPVLDVLDFALGVGFPIGKAVPIDAAPYRGDDLKSMADNNTSAFNFRPIAGTRKVSQHSYGLAVDLNPALNPYLTAEGEWLPSTSGTDRTAAAPGMLGPGEPVTEAFLARGFEWGGSWDRPDYHHFEFAEAPA